MVKGILESQGSTNIDSIFESKKMTESSKEMMGKDQFLQLLVTQLSKQDPLNPVSDTQFIAQMAQFSALEQTMKVSQSTEKIAQSLQRLEAQGMVGAHVEYQEHDVDIIQQGLVRGIATYSGNIFLKVDENLVQIENVTSVFTSNPQEQKQ